MLNLHETKRFRRDIKRVEKRGKKVSDLRAIVRTLLEEKPLDPSKKDHPLKGDLEGFRECHIEDDWLLIYTVNKHELVLTCSRTGTHTDLF
jgi:mRNA interferase YafQ